MKVINCKEFLTKENKLRHLFRKWTRSYHLRDLAKRMRIDTRMPPYPPHYGF